MILLFDLTGGSGASFDFPGVPDELQPVVERLSKGKWSQELRKMPGGQLEIIDNFTKGWAPGDFRRVLQAEKRRRGMPSTSRGQLPSMRRSGLSGGKMLAAGLGLALLAGGLGWALSSRESPRLPIDEQENQDQGDDEQP